jgi:hypothetical protein
MNGHHPPAIVQVALAILAVVVVYCLVVGAAGPGTQLCIGTGC